MCEVSTHVQSLASRLECSEEVIQSANYEKIVALMAGVETEQSLVANSRRAGVAGRSLKASLLSSKLVKDMLVVEAGSVVDPERRKVDC